MTVGGWQTGSQFDVYLCLSESVCVALQDVFDQARRMQAEAEQKKKERAERRRKQQEEKEKVGQLQQVRTFLILMMLLGDSGW